jgi:hypothetical protein
LENELKHRMLCFSKTFLAEHNLANFTEGRLDSLINSVLEVMNSSDFVGPFRHGRSNNFSVLDKNGKTVFNPGKRNANSKSKLLVVLLNQFYHFNSKNES